MSFYIYNQPIGSSVPAKAIKFGKTTKQDDGTVTFSTESGEVLSVQPGGYWEYRSAGTNGPYERATISGNTVTFDPTGDEPYPYMMFQTLNT